MEKIIVPICAFVAFVSISLSTHANVLLNAGFEDGLNDWETTGKATIRTDDPLAFEGTNYVFGRNTRNYSVSQNLDLVNLGLTITRIDTGLLNIEFGGWQSGWRSQRDNGQISIYLLDENMLQLGKISLDSFYSNHTWTKQTGSTTLLADTRFIKYEFVGVRSSGSNNDAYLDAAFLEIMEAELGPASFHFSNVANRLVDTAFPITIEARLANDEIDTNFNKCINLQTNYDFLIVSDPKVCLKNGTATENISLLGGSASGVKLMAEYLSITGASNPFTVTDELAVPAKLQVTVRVKPFAVHKIIGSVFLESTSDGKIIEQDQYFGTYYKYYIFENLSPGTYRVWAKDGNWRSRDKSITITAAHAPKTRTITLTLLDFGKPPVLLVPGFAGSSSNGGGDFDTGEYPRMPSNTFPPASDLRIFEGIEFLNIADAGFSELENTLSENYTVYLVPWDWRTNLESIEGKKNAWQEYLLPAIDEAKNPIKESDGQSIVYEYDKVHIVAHSLGGLMTRAYIQDISYTQRGEDIDKLAIVGTPNTGAVKTYYMTEGGDPKATDADADEDKCSKNPYPSNPHCFYSRLTLHLYQLKHGKGSSPFGITIRGDGSGVKDFSNPDKKELIEFYSKHVKTGKYLLPTFPFLDFDGDDTGLGALTGSNPFLEKLATDNIDRYARECGNTTKVRTLAFISNDQNTLTDLNVKVNPKRLDSSSYPHGIPNGFSPRKGKGDGTVPEISAEAPGLDISWLRMSKGKHSSMMRAFREEIKQFLDEDCE